MNQNIENISAAKAEINKQITRLMMLSRVIVNLNEAGSEITVFSYERLLTNCMPPIAFPYRAYLQWYHVL